MNKIMKFSWVLSIGGYSWYPIKIIIIKHKYLSSVGIFHSEKLKTFLLNAKVARII